MESRPLITESPPQPVELPPVLDVVVPVHDEEASLERCLRRLHVHLAESFPWSFRITVAENASTDATLAVARRVAAELPGVEVLTLPRPGRGGALRTAWLASDAAVLAYMDVDLSTDLAALLPLAAPLVSGHSDLAIGSRLRRSARVVRGTKRDVLSRGYNLLLHGTGTTSVSDAQCGFKAIRADVAEQLLPLVEDDGWFFDTELIWLAERAGLRVHEVPVDWVDDPDSRVDIGVTVRADLAGIVRLRRRRLRSRRALARLRQRVGRRPLPCGRPGPRRQFAAFAVVGALSAVVYLLSFAVLRTVTTAQQANLMAFLFATFGNTAANRRWTFGVRGRAGAWRAQLQGLLVASVGLATTSGALALLNAADPAAPRGVEVAVLAAATGVATVVRFVLFRSWLFRPRGIDAPPAPRRERLLLAGLLSSTAALYLIGLGRSGWGNAFYAAAAQAGAQSWEALFFGSSDAGNSITVDKPPAALWVMGLSVRLFGLSSWSLLVPEALMGVAAVALLVATVRRVAGPWAGLLAGLLLAVTPVLTLMARVDDPDALLTLCVVAAAWSVTRAIEDGRLRWALLTGALLGLAFLTKSLAAFLVLPGLAAAFLLAAPGRVPRRAGHALAAGAALLVGAGWWGLAVELVPASSRPWVGGSRTDNPLGLAFGYNGLGRLTGNEVGGGLTVVGTGSPLRLLGSAGEEVGWLLPAAALGLAAGLVLRRGRPRTDPVRAALLLWGGWALVTAVVFSVMRGIWHSYYTVELAPAVAALAALGGTLLWRRRTSTALAVLAVGSLASTGYAVATVDRRLAAGSGGTAVVLLLLLSTGLAGPLLIGAAGTGKPPLARLGLALALTAALIGPVTWSVATAARPHTGSAVQAGPVSGALLPAAGTRPVAGPDPALLRALRRDTDDWTWTAATVGRRAAALQLGAGAPVMPIGGFFGRDPAPTLSRFEADVRAHRIHWYVPGLHGSGPAPRIDRWVRAHAPTVRVGRTTIYDLAGLAASHHEDMT